MYYITEVKNENGVTVYHVIDDDIIQEFWTLLDAQEYVDYIKYVDYVNGRDKYGYDANIL